MHAAELDAARRLVRVMDEHLAEIDLVGSMGIPSDNQFAFYVSDEQGFIQIHQDAAFVVENITVVFAVEQDIQADLSWIRIVDRGPGLVLTLGQLFPAAASTEPQESSLVPWALLSPIPAVTASLPGNRDWVYRSPVEWMIARGTAVQVDAGQASPAMGAFEYLRVILSGYKVYG